jgi:hypothetical protein
MGLWSPEKLAGEEKEEKKETNVEEIIAGHRW